MQRIAVVVLLAMVLAWPAVGQSADGRYVAGELLVVYCEGAAHPLVPSGTPDDPTALDQWALSGEPECAPGDALNRVEGRNVSTGFGGYGWYWQRDAWSIGAAFTVTTEDLAVGVGDSYLSLSHATYAAQPNTAEGCGMQTLVLEEYGYHWQSADSGVLPFVWARIPVVGTDPDLRVCAASEGTVHSTVVQPDDDM